MRAILAGITLAVTATFAQGASGAEPVNLFADLSAEVLETVRRSADGTGSSAPILERIFVAAPPYHFEAGLLGVDTDHRWFQTLPPDVPGGPMLELRRWPGDTVLALYALDGESSPPGGRTIAEAKLSRIPGEGTDVLRFEGTLATTLGARPIAWLEYPVPGAQRRLGALLIPGDAGLGSEAIPGLVEELLHVVGRIRLRTDAWSLQTGIAPDTPLVAPELDAPPGNADEAQDPWQVVEGGAYTLGLPPGVRARRLDQGVPPPREVPSAVLWLRGRFLDRKGERVAIGDGARAGYLAMLPSLDRAWTTGERAPLGAPAAKRLAAEDFTIACEDTGADAARGERWSEAGFSGDWLVFRLVIKGAGVELGLPVLSGRQSEALFWIPTTLRGRGVSPAPPPVDPAERFGISFAQFSRLEQKRHPGYGGYLVVPGLRFELPSGWIPVTTLRSEDGFPVLLVNAAGRPVGRLFRIAAGEEGTEWVPVRKRKSGVVLRREDGARLHLGADGQGIVLVPERGVDQGTEWQRLYESATFLAKKVTRSTRPAAREEAPRDR